ncbi:MAG: YMGG-like glycine zipper-containing protein [Verrucomicrobiia bacterium]|jgi:outer membrane lipoprotein SlyB
MKNLINLIAVAMLALPAKAQIFSNESLTGALLGGVVGGIIGNNHHHQTAEGIAIGAASGLVLGSIVHNERERARYMATQVPVPATVSTVYAPAPNVVYAPAYTTTYVTQPSRPNYAVGGAILGGIVGGVIGHNHHRQTAEGIAIGAASGLVLGTIAEQNARLREQRAVVVQPATTVYYPVAQQVQQSAPQQQSSQRTLQPVSQPLPDYHPASSSPMAPANSLFGR